MESFEGTFQHCHKLHLPPWRPPRQPLRASVIQPPPTLTSPASLKGQQAAVSGTAGLQGDEEGEVSEGAESPGRRRESRGPAVSWVGGVQGIPRSLPVGSGLAFHVFFF